MPTLLQRDNTPRVAGFCLVVDQDSSVSETSKWKARKPMIRIIFRNLDRSELAKEAVMERMDQLIKKFPDLDGCLLNVTLEMQTSPLKAGPDNFSVKVRVATGRYKGLTLTKTASSLYLALADVVEHLLEALNRFGDRARVHSRSREREFVEERLLSSIANE